MRRGQITRRGVLLAGKAERAVSFADRLRGLLGRPSLGPGAALLLERCGAVHTVGMRFALDLVFVDRAWRVTRIIRNVRPGRLMVCGGWHAARVMESEAGCLELSDMRVGDTLVWEERRTYDEKN